MGTEGKESMELTVACALLRIPPQQALPEWHNEASAERVDESM